MTITLSWAGTKAWMKNHKLIVGTVVLVAVAGLVYVTDFHKTVAGWWPSGEEVATAPDTELSDAAEAALIAYLGGEHSQNVKDTIDAAGTKALMNKVSPQKLAEIIAQADGPAAAAAAAATPPAQTPPAQTPPAQTPPAQTPPAQTPTVQTPTAQTPPAQTPTVQTPTVQTPPAQTPTVQTPTVQTTVDPSIAAKLSVLAEVVKKQGETLNKSDAAYDIAEKQIAIGRKANKVGRDDNAEMQYAVDGLSNWATAKKKPPTDIEARLKARLAAGR